MGRDLAVVAALGKVAGLGVLAAMLMGTMPPRDPDPVWLVRALSGSFDNVAQFAAADPVLKVPPSVTGKWLDRQHARMVRVDAPKIGRDVLYLEWRGGGPDGAISRQRLWAFDRVQGGVSMRFYAFRKPEGFAGADARSPMFATLSDADLIGYPTACAARFQVKGKSWEGRIRPEECRIVAQSGRAMRLDVTIRVDTGGFAYQEAGILDSGVRAFAVPPTMPYRFTRVTKR